MKNQKIRYLLIAILTILSFAPAVSMSDENADAQLLRAVNLNEVDGVRAWLKKGANPNFTFGQRPLLSIAAQGGYSEIVKALINAKANLDTIDGIGQTALMRAAESDKPKALEVLVAAKAALDVQDQRGETALILATNNHSTIMVKALTEAGANLNLKNSDDTTAVMAAALANAEESAEIVSIVAKGKADLDSGNLVHTPLSYAVAQGNEPLVKVLLEGGANPNLKAQSGSFPLALAFDASEPKAIIDDLLEAKANPNVVSLSGKTPLQMAAEKGLLETVDKLLKSGADINAKDNYGNSALETAKRASHDDVAELLLKHGAAG